MDNPHDDDLIAVEVHQYREPRFVQVDLDCVRAADALLIRYDGERDGWVIMQASRFMWPAGEPCDPDYQEVAFVQAWGRRTDWDAHDG